MHGETIKIRKTRVQEGSTGLWSSEFVTWGVEQSYFRQAEQLPHVTVIEIHRGYVTSRESTGSDGT